VRRAALVLVALALTGCETTAEKSAKLEKEAERQPGHGQLKAKGLSIAHESTAVKVVEAVVVHSSEGSAAAVTLHNLSARALANVPIAITVRDASGATLYTNGAAGLARTLVSLTLLAPHAELTWVDDQVQGSGTPVSVSAKVGEGAPAGHGIPSIALQGAHEVQEGGGTVVDGNVANHSSVAQKELVVYAAARRGGRIVAAGRAIVPQLGAGATSPFQVFLIGDASGAQLQLSAPASTLR
jgi:hypothetical protein